MTLTALAPSTLFRTLAELSTPEMSRRASATLDVLARERGHGAVEELRRPLHTSRATFYDHRKGKSQLDPATVYKVAVIYTQDEYPSTPAELEAVMADEANLVKANELFWLFYSDNHREALAWLIANEPEHFACNATGPYPMVA